MCCDEIDVIDLKNDADGSDRYWRREYLSIKYSNSSSPFHFEGYSDPLIHL